MNIDSNDRQFFRSNPRRSYGCQLATPAEIDGIRTYGISVEPALRGERFAHCIATVTGRAFIAIGLLGDMDEQHCRLALHDADFIMGGQVARLAQ